MFSPDPVALTVFGFSVYWYAILITIGAVWGYLVAAMREKRKGVAPYTVLDFLLIAMPVAIVCARAYYVAFRFDEYRGDVKYMLSLRDGGLAIYGGVIGGVLTGVLFTKKRGISFRTLADLCAPGLALGQAIGRWGNFVNQEAYGVAVTREAWRFFPAAVYIQADETWHAATFFYESAWCLIVCAALLIMERRYFFRREGDLFGWYLFLYAAERMIVENLRTDSLMWGPVRVSQALSGGMILILAMITFMRGQRSGRRAFALAGVFIGLLLAMTYLINGLTAQALICAAALIALEALLYRGTYASDKVRGGERRGHGDGA